MNPEIPSTSGVSRTKTFILVKWVEDENTYSVITPDDICDDELSSNSLASESNYHVIGDVVRAFYKDDVYPATIIDLSRDKKAMEKKLNALVKEALDQSMAKKDFGKGRRHQVKNRKYGDEEEENSESENKTVKKKDKTRGSKKPRNTVLAELQNRQQLDGVQNTISGNEENECLKCPGLEEQLKKAKQNVNKYKERWKKLKANASQGVDIGGGIYMKGSDFDRLGYFSSSPAQYCTALLDIAFTPEELLNGSINGRQCGANKFSVVYPALDQRKINAILENTLNKYCTDKSYKSKMRTSLKKTMTQKLRKLRNPN